MAKVVVTGGAGFIGSHIADALVSRKDSVVIIDTLKGTNGSLRNIKHLEKNPLVSFSKTDIRHTDTLVELCKNADYILHHAALTSVPESFKIPAEYRSVNVEGTMSVLYAAKKAGARAVVLASSAAVYGANQNCPLKEETPLDPLSPYGLSKRENETMSASFAHLHEIPIVCLRYFNVFGERQDPKSSYAGVLPRFVKQALEGKPLTIEWDGKQTRDLVYVANVVEANLKAAKWALTQLSKRKPPFAVFNIATGIETSVNELAQKIIKTLKIKNAQIEYREKREGDIRRSLADITKAKKELNYNCKIGIDEGLERTINWYAKNPDFFD